MGGFYSRGTALTVFCILTSVVSAVSTRSHPAQRRSTAQITPDLSYPEPSSQVPSETTGIGISTSIDGGGGGTSTSTNSTSGPPVLVTATSNGETVVATYTSTTLSQYTDIRASTTITTSVSESETAVPIVILAGGVAWWLAGIAGPVGLIPGPPPSPPQGSKQDDVSCSPKPNCDDCGGGSSIGFCLTGDKASCPCDGERKCPSTEPKCDDSSCDGDAQSKTCKTSQLQDCPCEVSQQCPETPPQCDDTECDGNNDDKQCTQDNELEGCTCQAQQQCPSDPPKCTDETCGGDNGQHQCKAAGDFENCKCCPDTVPCSDETCEGEEGKCTSDTLKDCSCGQQDLPPLKVEGHEDETKFLPTNQQLDDDVSTVIMNIFGGDLNAFLMGKNSTEVHPASNPTCFPNSADAIPDKVLINNGVSDMKSLQYRTRETLCSGKCEVPQDIPSTAVAAIQKDNKCEISIILPNSIEAYARRETGGDGDQWQDCWDSFANITEKCDLSKPNKGWVNGPLNFEFYEMGYRPLNSNSDFHTSLDPKNALATSTSASTPPPTQSSTIFAAFPTATPLYCIEHPGGGWLADCWQLASQFGDSDEICSNDSKYCPADRTGTATCRASGSRCDDNGSDSLQTNSFCNLASFGQCAIVVSSKLQSFGFPGFSCVRGSDIKNMIALETTTNGCGGTPDQHKLLLNAVDGGRGTLCLTGADTPQACGA